MKYNVGDKVRIKSIDWYNENKDVTGNIRYKWDGSAYPVFFSKYMSNFCGEILTIKSVFKHSYHMNETSSCEFWTDEMIECKVEEEIKPEPKFKVGDKITNGEITFTILTLSSDRYGAEDTFGECGSVCFKSQDEWKIVEEKTKPKFKEGDRITNGIATLTILTLASDRYIVEDNFGGCGTLYFNTRDDWKIVEDETYDFLKTDKPNQPSLNDFMDMLDNEIKLPEGYIFKDENGNEILTSKIILEKKNDKKENFLRELSELLNKYSIDSKMDMPDYVLAEYIWKTLFVNE